MAQFVKGEVVVIPFPFSDLSDKKRRPAMVLMDLHDGDVVLCQITSQTVRDAHAIPISADDFDTGCLRLVSHIRPNRVFTLQRNLIVYSCGRLNGVKTGEVVGRLVALLNR